MNCNINININGTQTSIPLAGLPDNTSPNQIKLNFNKILQDISEMDVIDRSNTNQFYQSVLSVYDLLNKNNKIIDKTESTIDPSKEYKTLEFNSINDLNKFDIDVSFFETLNSTFNSNFNPKVKIIADVFDNDEVSSNYNIDNNLITIHTPKKYNPIFIEKELSKQVVKAILDTKFDPSDPEINKTYRDIKSIFKSRGFVGELEKEYKNTHIRIKEYLAESLSKLIMFDENGTEEKINKLKSLSSYKPTINLSKQISGYNKTLDDFVYIQSISERLSKLYGFDFKLLTSNEISEIYDGDRIFSDKRAFVIDNEIVINSDLASIAEPLHELTHILLPMIRKSNIEGYNTLLSAARSHPDYNNIAMYYNELSGLDLDEEVFCTIFGEYYAKTIRTEQGNDWNKNNKSWFSNIVNKIKSFLSSVFNLSNEFNDFSPNMFMNMSFSEIMDKFGDNIIQGKYENMVSVYNEKFDNKINRMLQIMYSKELIKKECYE